MPDTETTMATITARVSVKRAWWVLPYLRSIEVFCWMTGMTPDLDKVSATVMRGFKMKVE